MNLPAARVQDLTNTYVPFSPQRLIASGTFICPTSNTGTVYLEGLDQADAVTDVPVAGSFVVVNLDLSRLRFKSSEPAFDRIVFLGGD